MDRALMNLIRKYDVSGPRYTSYPPAPLFSHDFDAADYKEAILTREANAPSGDFSLYVHLPFCDTLCYFCGCTTFVTKNHEHIDQYVRYLKKEIALLSQQLGDNRKLVQLHWGGGTPTYLKPSQIEEVGSAIRHSFSIDPNAEMSVEVDPRGLTYTHLKTLRDLGFNRISLGVQDFDAKVQYAINRNQSEFITLQAIDWSRRLKFQSLNIDLIYGLPMQSVKSFANALEKVIDISPDRIAVYNFAYVPWIKKHQKLISPDDLPSAETKLELLMTATETLTAAGYVYIGMDHFAKPTDDLTLAQKSRTLHRNFQGYSTKGGADLYGLGLSSIGHFGSVYAQNAKTLNEYYEAIDKGNFATCAGYRMTEDDEIRKFVIMRIMCHLVLDKNEVEGLFKINFDEYFSESLSKLVPLIHDGLLVASSNELKVTDAGRMFLRNIAMAFDAYLAKKDAHHVTYSRTV